MLGGILFASTQGSGLDCYAKQWRLFADITNDAGTAAVTAQRSGLLWVASVVAVAGGLLAEPTLQPLPLHALYCKLYCKMSALPLCAGMALELASPLLPGAFLLLACLGSVARAVTGVAGGATRMALTQHFAQRQNGADIAAKEGSQASNCPGCLIGRLSRHSTLPACPCLHRACFCLPVPASCLLLPPLPASACRPVDAASPVFAQRPPASSPALHCAALPCAARRRLL